MRILQIFRQFLPATGGIERVMYGLSRSLQQAGHRCDIVTLRYLFNRREMADPAAQIDGLQIYRLPHIGIQRYPIAPAVLSFVPGYDLVHIHAIDFFVDFLVATRGVHRRPLVINTHGGIFHTRWLLPFKKFYFRTITRLSLHRADAVICDSQHDYDLFRRIVPAEKLHIISNGVNIEPLLAIEKQLEPGMLLGIGRIVENKHVERLIELLPALAATVPDVHLVWVGVDGQQRIPQLLALAQRLGVAARVQFVGEISDERLRELLAQAHLFVSASSYEAFGVATIEAMSSATVPVVTPVGVHTEVIREGQTGFLCSYEGPQALDTLRHALTLDSHRLRSIGAQARAATLPYSWQRVVEQYIAVYQAVV